MSRTDKDDPAWVKGHHDPNNYRTYENHAWGCLTEAPRFPRTPNRKRVKIKGDWEWVECYKFTDSLGNVFWAPERIRDWYSTRPGQGLSKVYDFEAEEHPNPVQKMNLDNLYSKRISEYRWFQRTIYVWDYGDPEFQPCDIDQIDGKCKRYIWKQGCCNGCSWCQGEGNPVERHSAKQRLQDMKHDYNSGYDVDDEEQYFVSTKRYSQDVSWYC